MMRLRAALWAVLVTLAVFGAAYAVQRWLLGPSGFTDVILSRWFGLAALGFNTVAIAVVAIVIAIRTKRAEKELAEKLRRRD